MEEKLIEKGQELTSAAHARITEWRGGQGTSEYAILVGIIVIIAVVAVLVFGDKLGDMWDAANSNMQQVLDWSH